MGPRNAAKVLEFAADYAKGRRLYLTTTHFHPEHAFGAQAFAGEATYLANRAQADDLAARGAGYLDMFRAMGEPVARQLKASSSPLPTSSTTALAISTSATGSSTCGPLARPIPRATRW